MFTQIPIPWNKRKQKRKRNIFKTNAFSLSFVSFFFFKDDALSRTSSRVIVEVPGRASSSLSLSNEILVRLVVALRSLSLLACCSSSNMSLSLRFAVGYLIGNPIQID